MLPDGYFNVMKLLRCTRNPFNSANSAIYANAPIILKSQFSCIFAQILNRNEPCYFMSKLMSVLILIFIITSCALGDASNNISAKHDLLRDVSAIAENGSINVVVEIPAGTIDKWEINKLSGVLEWERINPDSLRQVKYLPYPANYGFIPRTWLPALDGGDDDPLDVILLGASVQRGSVIESRVLGVIRILDRGEQDDKLIAVATDGPFWDVHTLEDLRTQYPGTVEILTTWLANYKGQGFVVIESVENELVAREILNAAIKWFDSVPDPYL